MKERITVIKKVEPQATPSIEILIGLGLVWRNTSGRRSRVIERVCENTSPSEIRSLSCGFSCDGEHYEADFMFEFQSDENGGWINVQIVDKKAIDTNCRSLDYIPYYGYKGNSDLTTYLIRLAEVATNEIESKRVMVSTLDTGNLVGTYTHKILAHKEVPMEYIVKNKGWLVDMKGYHDTSLYYCASDNATYHGAIIAGVVILSGECGNEATKEEVRRVFYKIVMPRVEDYYADVAQATEDAEGEA